MSDDDNLWEETEEIRERIGKKVAITGSVALVSLAFPPAAVAVGLLGEVVDVLS